MLRKKYDTIGGECNYFEDVVDVVNISSKASHEGIMGINHIDRWFLGLRTYQLCWKVSMIPLLKEHFIP